MWKPKKIMVPTDFSTGSNEAIYFAVMLAEPFASEVTLFHAISLFEADPNNPDYRFPKIEEIYAALEETASKRMDEIDRSHQKIKFRKVMVRGISPTEEIVSFAQDQKMDLIVMGTHGRSGLSHFMLGSVAEKIIRHMPCPVVTIHHPGEKKKRSYAGIERIVVPIDFSPYSKQAVETAAVVAGKFGAELQFLHVIEEQVHPSHYVTGKTSIFAFVPDLMNKSEAAMKKFVEPNLPASVQRTFHVVEGRAHTAIVEFAEQQKAGLIAIASHGLSGLEHFLVGSTTERVVRHAKIPVLAVKARTS